MSVRHVPPQPRKKPIYKRVWVIAIAATVAWFLTLIFGIGIGVLGSTVPTEAADSGPSQEEHERALEAAEAAEARVGELEGQLADSQAEVETIAGELPVREEAIQDARKKLSTDRRALKRDRRNLTVAQRAVKKRERAVSTVERKIRNGTIGGDGIYEVGTDIPGGTYKTTGRGSAFGCYYAVLRRPNSDGIDNIISNNNIDGPGIVQVVSGQYLELSGCGDWVLQP